MGRSMERPSRPLSRFTCLQMHASGRLHRYRRGRSGLVAAVRLRGLQRLRDSGISLRQSGRPPLSRRAYRPRHHAPVGSCAVIAPSGYPPPRGTYWPFRTRSIAKLRAPQTGFHRRPDGHNPPTRSARWALPGWRRQTDPPPVPSQHIHCPVPMPQPRGLTPGSTGLAALAG